MQIFLRETNLELSAKIRDIKLIFEERTGIRASTLTLNFNQQELQDDRTFASYNIDRDCPIKVLVPLQQGTTAG